MAAPATGHVQAVEAVRIGVAALELGAGRRDKDDVIDHGVGIVLRKKRGDAVGAGEAVAEVHATTEARADAATPEVLAAFELADETPRERGVILDVIR